MSLHGRRVDFDLTFIAQFLLLATFIVILTPLLFDPLLRVFEERERRSSISKRSSPGVTGDP